MAFTLVQKSAAVTITTGGTTVTPTLPGNTTAGNLLVCVLSNSSNAAWSLPAGWVQFPGGRAANSGNAASEIWYNPGNAGGISSVVCTSGTSANLHAALAEYSLGTAAPLNSNPTFETDVSGWTKTTLGAGTFVQDATHVHTGSFAGKITPDGVTATPFIFCQGLVSPLQTVTFAPWLFVSGGPVTITIFLQFFNFSGTFLGQATASGSVTTAFQQLVASLTVPAGATVYNALIQYSGTPANTVLCWVDDAYVTAVSPDAVGTGIAGAVKTCPVTTGTAPVAADLVVGAWHQRFVTTTAVTWTDPASFTLLQSDTATSTHHLYSAYELAAPGTSLTVTPTSSVAADSGFGWSGVVASFTSGPDTSGGATGTPGLVGCFNNQNIFGPGTTVQQAIADWVAIAARPLTVRRVYFTAPPAAINNDLLADAAAGRKVAMSFRPAFNPPSNADAAALDAFLSSCKNAGLIADVALYSEAYTSSVNGVSPGITPALTIAATRFYAPTVRQYYPLVFSTGSFGVNHHAENTWYAGDAFIDKIATDYYASSWVGGDRLDLAASLADSAVPPKPFGVWEFNSSTNINPATGLPYQSVAQATAYFAYIQQYFAARLAAGKTNADLILFNSGAGSVALNSPVTTTTDFRMPLWQAIFDALNGGAGANPQALSSEVDLLLDINTTLVSTVPAFPPAPGAPQSATFPHLFLELGMPAASPVGAPTVFILDDPVFGKLDSARLGSGTTWVDITGFLRSGTVTRPATRVQGPLLTYQASTLSVVLKNGDGRFDPDNLSGPYVTAGVSSVRPMIPVRLRAVWNGVEYFLFQGFADAWQDDGANYAGHYAETALSATDGFKVLNGITLPPLVNPDGTPAPVGPGETTGARIARILTAAGWYTDHRKIATGDSTVQATVFGDTAGNLLQVTADSEIGELYIDGAGYLTFRNRHAILTDTRSTVPQGVFGDQSGTVDPAGTERPYVTVGRADDDTTLANDIQITNANIGTLQEARNTGSIARYLFPRTYSRSDILLQTDADALNYAGWVLGVSTDAEDRFDTLTLTPARDANDLFPQALGRQIGDRIQVWRRPPGAGTVTKDCFVRGITHTLDAGLRSWQTVFDLQDSAKYASFLILDQAVTGRLDHNKLAF